MVSLRLRFILAAMLAVEFSLQELELGLLNWFVFDLVRIYKPFSRNTYRVSLPLAHNCSSRPT